MIHTKKSTKKQVPVTYYPDREFRLGVCTTAGTGKVEATGTTTTSYSVQLQVQAELELGARPGPELSESELTRPADCSVPRLTGSATGTGTGSVALHTQFHTLAHTGAGTA